MMGSEGFLPAGEISMLLFKRSIVAVASTVVLGGLLAGCDPSGEPAVRSRDARPVKTLVVEASPMQVRRDYPAVVLPGQEVELSFRVSGQIMDLPIRGASRVGKGDLVAQLDPRDFETELARLQSQLAQAQAQLVVLTSGARAEDVAVLEAEVAAARAEADGAAAEVERSRALFERRVVARAKLDGDLTKLRIAEAALEAKRQQLVKGRAGAREEEVAAQQAALDGLELAVATARASLTDTGLRAPFGGIIAKRLVESFANVQANEPIAVLQKLDTLTLSFDVPGPDVAELAGRETLSSVAVLDSLPGQEFAARLVEFSTQADPATQTYRGRVAISVPGDVVILPGMVGSVIVTDTIEGRAEIAVPLTALGSEADGTPFVWVVAGADHRVSRRIIETGEASGVVVAVVEGLNEGDVVVTAGVSALVDGMQVRPVTAIGG